MPRAGPTEYLRLDLHAPGLTAGFPLHDVWQVDLEGTRELSIQDLRRLATPEAARLLGLQVRALLRLRSVLGHIFRLDGTSRRSPGSDLVDSVPSAVAAASQVPPGTVQGPFTTLYALPHEAAYEASNRTVHAILVVVLVTSSGRQRLLWATHVKPIGRITAIYMKLIDPFRRTLVYPGLEAWLKRLVPRLDAGPEDRA